MEYVLIVTWFLGANAISSYQVPFATRQTCDVALSDLRNDAQRLASSRGQVLTITGAAGAAAGSAPDNASSGPVLSAICANQR